MPEVKREPVTWFDADPILFPFLQAENADESQRALDQIVAEPVESLIRALLKSKFSSQTDWQFINQDLEDLVNCALVQLVAELL